MFLGLALVEPPLSESTSVTGLGSVDEGWDTSNVSWATVPNRAGVSTVFGGVFQISSDSHNTRSKLGFMFKLGQKTSRRFAMGIFVWRLLFAVVFMSSTRV